MVLFTVVACIFGVGVWRLVCGGLWFVVVVFVCVGDGGGGGGCCC